MKTLLRVVMVLAVVTLTGAGTPLPTGDDRPVSQFDVVLDLSVLAQAPALALLTEAEMSAVLGAGYDFEEFFCRGLSEASGSIIMRGLVYKGCMWAMKNLPQ